MKNVHVIPTEKESTGYILGKCIKELSDVKIGQFVKTHYMLFDKEYFQPQSIYITSDEEIKEGDWCLGMDGIFQYKGKVNLPDVELPKKIILTTDQDLIADGVQAIDDEFLEWFVKNPSCESVEVHKNPFYEESNYKHYKIIIPQEETKLINNCPKCGLDLVEREGSKPVCHRVDCGGIILSNETLREWELKKEPKQEMAGKAFYESADKVIVVKRQETLEEAAEKYAISSFDSLLKDVDDHFIAGAKWQAERMYSLADLEVAFFEGRKKNSTFVELFEQFKKK